MKYILSPETQEEELESNDNKPCKENEEEEESEDNNEDKE